VDAVLSQKKDNKPYAIYYASYTLDEAQVNYAMMEKEFLVVVFALEKFRSYLINSKVIVFIDHAALKNLMKKFDSKSRLIRWVLFLQEFNLEIKNKTRLANVVADHLSRLGPEATPSEELLIDDSFLDEQLLTISHQATSCYVDLVNFKVYGCYLQDCPTNKGRNSFPMSNTMCKRSLCFISCVEMESIEDAC